MTAKNAAKSFSVNKERNRMSSVRLAPALPMINASTVGTHAFGHQSRWRYDGFSANIQRQADDSGNWNGKGIIWACILLQ